MNSVEREHTLCPRLDMNALDTTKILCSSSKGSHVYDIRNLNKRVFSIENHTGRTTCALWSPHRDYVYATSSVDRHVSIMDMSEVDRYSNNEPNVVQQANIVVQL